MANVLIKFTRQAGLYNPEEIAGFDEKTAAAFVAQGSAVYCDSEGTPAAEPEEASSSTQAAEPGDQQPAAEAPKKKKK